MAIDQSSRPDHRPASANDDHDILSLALGSAREIIRENPEWALTGKYASLTEQELFERLASHHWTARPNEIDTPTDPSATQASYTVSRGDCTLDGVRLLLAQLDFFGSPDPDHAPLGTEERP